MCGYRAIDSPRPRLSLSLGGNLFSRSRKLSKALDYFDVKVTLVVVTFWSGEMSPAYMHQLVNDYLS